jgi:DNA-binding transcriptional regulator GbsR (MarR family)
MRNLPSKSAMSVQEIAEETGMSVSAVNMTISRALRKLRRQGIALTMRDLAQDLDRNRKGSVDWQI